MGTNGELKAPESGERGSFQTRILGGGLFVSGRWYDVCSELATERGDVDADVRMLDASDGVAAWRA